MKTYTFLACALCLLFLLGNALIFAPAHGEVDQNAYLVGGKLLAQNGSMAYRIENPTTGEQDPYLFIGHMWVGFDLDTADQRYYPKYPIGLPAMVAAVLKAAGPERGVWLSYWISPVCMSLALLATFFLVRLVAHPLLALISVVSLFGSSMVLNLGNNPNSHAADLAFVAWGIYFLLSWWQKGGAFRAVAAGLLLGYAVTIRYTEGLLLLPVLLVVFMNHAARGTSTRNIQQSAALLTSWGLPVVFLFAHNILAFGDLTGYETTNESTGFAWSYFVDNWDATLRQLGDNALVFMFPFALAGMVGMFWWNWRLALVLAAWIIPSTLAYTAFYWAPDSARHGRFFLSVVPALVMCAFWFLSQVKLAVSHHHGSVDIPASSSPLPTAQPGPWQTSTSALTPAALAIISLVTLLTIAVGLAQSVPDVTSDYTKRKILHDAGKMIQKFAPLGSVIVSEDRSILHHLQFVADYQLYNSESFKKWRIQSPAEIDPNAPQMWQPQQRQMLYDRMNKLSQQDLENELHDKFRRALANGQDVFFIKREERPARPTRKPNSTSGTREQASGQPASSPAPLLSPEIAPPGEFSASVVATWLPVAPQVSGIRLADESGRKNQSRERPWQLIQITTNSQR